MVVKKTLKFFNTMIKNLWSVMVSGKSFKRKNEIIAGLKKINIDCFTYTHLRIRELISIEEVTLNF